MGTKSKKLLKASERKASKKLEDRKTDSDSEDDSTRAKEKKKHSETERTFQNQMLSKKEINMNRSSEVSSWRDEFDDGLGEDLIGDDEDRERLESMTEKEREEEIFKRAEKREELKKRFEISKKLKLQLKDKASS